jgi:hypothetical protein
METIKFYPGNYGYPLNKIPEVGFFEIPSWAFEFISTELSKNISRKNRLSWAKQKLEILSNMLEDRAAKNTEFIWFAGELKKISEKIGD